MNNKEQERIKWCLQYGRDLLNKKEDILNVYSNDLKVSELTRISSIFKFLEELIYSKSIEMKREDFIPLIHAYFHLSGIVSRMYSESDTISIKERFETYFNTVKEDPVVALRDDLAKVRSKGISTRCVVCDQHVKEYKKTLSANSARFLFSLVSISKTKKDGWVHYTDCIYHSRNYPEVAYWGLAHTMKSEEKNKKTTGYWKPTQLGIDFVKNNAKIPKYVHVYNSNVVKIDGSEKISIIDAFGKNFDYSELMKGF